MGKPRLLRILAENVPSSQGRVVPKVMKSLMLPTSPTCPVNISIRYPFLRCWQILAVEQRVGVAIRTGGDDMRRTKARLAQLIERARTK
jgi:hypothetical protein